jgi:hypothetical protein
MAKMLPQRQLQVFPHDGKKLTFYFRVYYISFMKNKKEYIIFTFKGYNRRGKYNQN